MKNGCITEFIDKLYYGEELVFTHKGVKYFLQGWTAEEAATMVLDIAETSLFSGYIWKHEAPTIRACAEEFLKAQIWDGRDFLQIESDVEWADW